MEEKGQQRKQEAVSLWTGILMQTGKNKLLKADYAEVLYAIDSSVNEWDYFYWVFTMYFLRFL